MYAATFADDVIDANLKDAESYLDTIAKSETLSNIKTATQVIFGSAAPEILATACSYNIDLIVMTSQGRTGMQRWMLGSVAQKIARSSSAPVLVLHEQGPLPVNPHLENTPLRVLVPLDGSVLARTALEPALQLLAAIAAPAQGKDLSKNDN